MADLITAVLTYAVPPADGSKPYAYAYVADPNTKERKRNFTSRDHEVQIENVRGKEDQYSLDKSGFAFVKAVSKQKAFTDNEEIAEEYYPESAELIKKLTGATRVVVFDHSMLILTLRYRVSDDYRSNSPPYARCCRYKSFNSSTRTYGTR